MMRPSLSDVPPPHQLGGTARPRLPFLNFEGKRSASFLFASSIRTQPCGNDREISGLGQVSQIVLLQRRVASLSARYSERCVNISRNSHIQMLTNCTCSFLREKAPGLARWVRLRKRVCSSVVVCKLYMGQYGEIVRRLLSNHRSDNLATEQVNAPILNNYSIRHISDFGPISSEDSPW